MKGRFDRKRFVVVALLTAMLLTGAMTAGAQTLTVWVGDGPARMEEYEVVKRLFEEQNPGITVDLVLQSGNQAAVMEKVILGIIAGAPPDLMWLEGSGVIEFAAQGLLMDLTDTLEGLRFAPSDTQEMTYDGRMWAVPYHTTARGLFKRVEYFDEVGLDPYVDPSDLEELYQWNLRLVQVDANGNYTRAGFIPWRGNWSAPGWIWTFGGELLEIDGTTYRPTANDPKNIEAFEWIRSWGQFYGHRQDPVQGSFAGFQAGTIAMVTESTSAVTRLADAGLEFTVGRVPHPEGGRNGTWGGGTAVGVPINAPNPELSLKLARFFGEADVQAQRFEEAPHGLPANFDALIEVGRHLPPQFSALLDQLPEARPRTPLWLEYNTQRLGTAMRAVATGQVTPEEALNDIQRVMVVRFAEVFGN